MIAAAEYITGTLITGLALDAALVVWHLVPFVRRRRTVTCEVRSVRP
jgi:hypothetical protein